MAGKPQGTPDSRFWAKVDKTDSCWLWTGTVSVGYGQFWDGKKQVGAHRWVYEHLVGPIPPGMTIDHLCRVRNCVNPDHLEVVSYSVNNLRSSRCGGESHCKRGHERTPENTYITPAGYMRCRICNLDNVLAYQARKRKEKAA